MVAEDKDDFLRLTGLQVHLDVVRAVRRPAMRDGIERLPLLHRRRVVPTAIGAKECIALRVEAGKFFRAGEIREVIAALAILGLVIDDPVHNLDLAGAEIALEVGGVILGVPETELDTGENGEPGRFFAAVGHLEFPDLQRFAHRHKITRLRLNLVTARTDDGIAHAVAAFVPVQFGPRGLPGGRPKPAGIVVAEIEVASAKIERGIVVAVARQAAQAGVPVKGIAAGGVRDEAEIGFAAEVIDPRQRGVGLGDDVFPFIVVEMSKTHIDDFRTRY